MAKRELHILGTRGIPATHGGFETFAEHLALYLVERGWRVTVYCQSDDVAGEDEWKGVRRVSIQPALRGPAGTVLFDLGSIRRARNARGLCLSLGYGTACFFPLLRLAGRVNVVNMDGMEWQRSQWGPFARLWLKWNEQLATRWGDHLVADHPEIARYFAGRVDANRLSMIPYGADRIESAPTAPVYGLGLTPDRYALVVARPERDNSVLEIVRAFSCRRRGMRLAVLGRFDPKANAYHRGVMEAASDEVTFAGAIYERQTVQALRYHARLYLHGHQVGGTNPSLVEALGAGNAVLAHDNPFNRWVAGSAAHYFRDEAQCVRVLDTILGDTGAIRQLRENARGEFDRFEWRRVLSEYERLLQSFVGNGADGRSTI